HANKSARVPHLSHEHIADLYFTRSVIETKAYELLATSGVDAASPRRAHEQVIAAMDDIPGHVVADIEFHADLLGALGSMRLTRAHRTILNEMQLCLAQVQVHRLLDPAIIVREHEEILQAIEAGDPRTAAEAGQRHLDNAKERLLRHVTGRWRTSRGAGTTSPAASAPTPGQHPANSSGPVVLMSDAPPGSRVKRRTATTSSAEN